MKYTKLLLIWIICSFPCVLFSATFSTFYGPLEVNEPVLIELIESPCFQRLKNIHQYGVSYYTSHQEEYNRYDHSLGVFAILRLKGASLEEQIAGLLHDVSHTAFSHVGDWVFKKNNQETDYQNSIHEHFIWKYGLGDILMKYKISPEQILPVESLHPMLEQKGPALCADRIEYNIQGAFYQNFITYEEALQILDDLRYINGNWICSKPELMKKLGYFALFMSHTCWGSVHNHCVSTWLAQALLRAVDIKLISLDDIHIGRDDHIWNCLCCCQDEAILNLIHKILFADSYYVVVNESSEAAYHLKSKFRGINPFVVTAEGIKKLTEVDADYREEYAKTKALMERGWWLELK